MYPEIDIKFSELDISLNGGIVPLAVEGSFLFDFEREEIVAIYLDTVAPRATHELTEDHPQYNFIKDLLESEANSSLIEVSRPSEDEILDQAAAHHADLKRDEVAA